MKEQWNKGDEFWQAEAIVNTRFGPATICQNQDSMGEMGLPTESRQESINAACDWLDLQHESYRELVTIWIRKHVVQCVDADGAITGSSITGSMVCICGGNNNERE